MHLPEANLPVTRSLSTRMARWGLVIVGIYLALPAATAQFHREDALPAPDLTRRGPNQAQSGPSLQ